MNDRRVSPIVFLFVLLLPCVALAQPSGEVGDALNALIGRGMVNRWIKNDPVTTSIRDVNKRAALPEAFGNDQLFRPMHRRPRTPTNGYVLTPGFYELRSRSYCIRAGTHAPSNGDGYLRGPLLGRQADMVKTILTRSAAHPEIPQHEVQMLLWAIIARSDFRSMNSQLVGIASALLTPGQLVRLNKQMLLQLALDVANITQLPREVQYIFQAENQIRQAFSQAQLVFQDVERLAMLAGPAVIDNPDIRRGQWSKHPDGYFVRYYPAGYSRTIIQVYVPDELPSVAFDAANDVAVPANTGAQRLALSNIPFDTTGYAPEVPPTVVTKSPTPVVVSTPNPVTVSMPPPVPVIVYRMVCGHVVDAQTRKPVADATIQFANQTLTADAEGQFKITDLTASQRINLVVEAIGYQQGSMLVYIDQLANCQPITILLVPNSDPIPTPAPSVVLGNVTLSEGESIVLNNIRFEQTKSELLPAGQTELDSIAAWLESHPVLRIELSGHTSSEGKRADNLELSKQRVIFCKKYLIRKGIDARRITAIGYGQDRPIAPNDNPESAARNRRVELKILKL